MQKTQTKASLALAALAFAAGLAAAQAPAHPLLDEADPFITLHPVAGNYLLLGTTGTNITLWSGPTVPTAATNSTTVFTPTNGMHELWSPTLWQWDNHWWIYFTARLPSQEHGIFLLRSNTADPRGAYTYQGQVDLRGRASIDPSLLVVNGVHYLMYVTVDSGANEIRMVRLADPLHPVGPDARIATPEYPWEKGAGTTRNYPVDEGPTALYHQGKTFIVFSASDTASPRYCLGLLTYAGGDPLVAAHWTKTPQPVFEASPGNGIWGPGRGTFAIGAHGENWLLYAAKTTDAPTARGRATRAQQFTWRPDGTPDFGAPGQPPPAASAPTAPQPAAPRHR